MHKKGSVLSYRVAAICLGVTVCGLSQAAALGTYSVSPTDSDDRIVPGFYPNVELDLGYNDNLLLTETNKQSSLVAYLKPELQWVGVIRKHLIRFGYQGEYANVFDQSSENYRDHFLGADITLDLTPKFTMNAGANYRKEHEVRGTAGALNIGTRPNQWDQSSVEVEAIYGRRIATAQIAAKYEYYNRDFTNNAQSTRDYDANIFTFAAYYNLGPKTQLLIEPSFSDYEYVNSAQDNTVRKLLAGVTWTATAKTTGKLKIGRYSKDFDSAAFADSSGASADIEVVWEPKTYSTVVLKISRDVNDSSLAGSSSYESSIASLDWNHDLTDLTQLQLGAAYSVDDYDITRKDKFIDGYIGISRSVTRNLTLGVRYDYGQRKSSLAGNDYKNNLVMVGVKTTFD